MRWKQPRPLLPPPGLSKNILNDIARENLGKHPQRDTVRQPHRPQVITRSLYLPNSCHTKIIPQLTLKGGLTTSQSTRHGQDPARVTILHARKQLPMGY